LIKENPLEHIDIYNVPKGDKKEAFTEGEISGILKGMINDKKNREIEFDTRVSK
jgi:hypothetical protein